MSWRSTHHKNQKMTSVIVMQPQLLKLVRRQEDCQNLHSHSRVLPDENEQPYHHNQKTHHYHQRKSAFRKLSLHFIYFFINFITTTFSQLCCHFLPRPTSCHQTLSTKRPCSFQRKCHIISTTSKKMQQTSAGAYRWQGFCLGLLLILSCCLPSSNACGPGRRLPSRQHHRRLTPLVFKQHIPNVSENTLGASGLSEGRVARNHSRFKELVPNYNADIIFRDDEGTGADRLMTQRLKEKLNTLAISVMNQWPGVRLRVTQSWHEGNQYAGESLHYEGRAVDITTNDRDRSKLGMLARLAVEAGFDWVYYESRVWIHCSVKSEKSESARNGGCFDEESIVYDRIAGPRSIKDVQVGDELLAMSSDGHTYTYSPVLLFLDRDPSIERLYYHIETSSGANITVTASHLLFVAENVRENELTATSTSTQQPQFAKDISIGQYLYTRKIDTNGRQSPEEVSLERVVKISTSLGKGAYAPLTVAGNLVVNNITASCYAVISSQTLAHLSFAPVRWAHYFVEIGDRLSSFILPKSSSSSESFSSRRTSSASTNKQQVVLPVKENGNHVHWYAKLLYGFFRYLIPSKYMFN